jgi:hypothetical protein
MGRTQLLKPDDVKKVVRETFVALCHTQMMVEGITPTVPQTEAPEPPAEAAAVPVTAQAAPETDDYKTPEPPANAEADETVDLDATLAALKAAAAAVPAATATFTNADPDLTQALPIITLDGIRNEIAAVIGVHADTGGADVHVTAPSQDIEPSICPTNIGTAACITTAIIGLVAIAAASM